MKLDQNTSQFRMNANRFKDAVIQSLEHARGTYIYEAARRDLEEKTLPADPCGYRTWLGGLLGYCTRTFQLDHARILDLGCGTGEFSVIMNLLGYDAIGADVNEHTLRLAKILATENDIAANRFVKISDRCLPFENNTFDIITMISMLEHVDDDALLWLVPELARICRGVVFVQVPSAMKVSDDHTGLKFVPWLPRRIAASYVALRGKRYKYLVSASASWDVVYRDLLQVERHFASQFAMDIVPPRHSYPPCVEKDAVLDIRKRLQLGPISFSLRIPLLHRYLRKLAGTRIEYFYPYYNLIFRKLCA